MRVALLSPYSWTYPGGVTRHIEALAGELESAGHHVRVLAPFDHEGRRAALLHRGAHPEPRSVPDYLRPVGGTVGWPSNGAVSNLALTPSAVARLRRELEQGAFDVVHLHEPVAPVVGWDALTTARAPLVGTFHCYSESVPPHAAAALLGARRKLNRLRVRIAVSEAAAWTGRRFYGGEYRIVPNGVTLPAGGAPGGVAALLGPPLAVGGRRHLRRRGWRTRVLRRRTVRLLLISVRGFLGDGDGGRASAHDERNRNGCRDGPGAGGHTAPGSGQQPAACDLSPGHRGEDRGR